ncbi:hypothetical protein [Mesorhizobium sp. M0276]|uniref:hypothetical protein n=1 Tax=Mesorhizobium sp. M0276 TaxID=2956928 RepID=UPI00333A7BB9
MLLIRHTVGYLSEEEDNVAVAEDALSDAFAAALAGSLAACGGAQAPRRRRLTGAARDVLRLVAEEMELRMADEDLPDEKSINCAATIADAEGAAAGIEPT